MGNSWFFRSFVDALTSEFTEEQKVVTSNGSTLLKNVPKVAPKAYLHYLFSPLGEKQINYMEGELAYSLPEELRAFYRQMNGLKLFGGAMYLNGLRTDSARTVEANNQQPFDILLPNSLNHAYHIPNTIYLGAYKFDGSVIGYNVADGSIHRQLKTDKVRLNTWASMSEFLDSEYRRLKTLFDEDGLKKEGVTATTPATYH